MIRITALYPNAPGTTFDGRYYVDRHTPFATKLLGGHGLHEIRTTLGLESLDGAPPAFWAISEMIFSSRAAFDAAMMACGAELFADVPHYTDTTPVLQLSALQGE